MSPTMASATVPLPTTSLIERADLRHGRAPIDEDDGLDAPPGQLHGRRLADAAGGPGDQGDFPFDLHVLLLPSAGERQLSGRR